MVPAPVEVVEVYPTRRDSIMAMAKRMFHEDLVNKSSLSNMMADKNYARTRAHNAINASVIFHDEFDKMVPE